MGPWVPTAPPFRVTHDTCVLGWDIRLDKVVITFKVFFLCSGPHMLTTSQIITRVPLSASLSCGLTPALTQWAHSQHTLVVSFGLSLLH